MVGVLFIPQMHLGPIYSTPELALVIGNIYSYMVSPKQKVVLKLKRKSKIASNIADFVFKPSQRLVFEPGQYMEFTLAHPKPDSRGNRRYFTLASSPTEESLHLGVRFYADSSSFKKSLYRHRWPHNNDCGTDRRRFYASRRPRAKTGFHCWRYRYYTIQEHVEISPRHETATRYCPFLCK